MGSRIIRKVKEMQSQAVEIIAFSPEHREAFRRLNEEWLKEHFTIEEDDDRLLRYPEEEIIAPGGAIIFARLKGKIVGTAALLKRDEKTYEIAKMAVTPSAQGKQAGRLLAEAAIARAREKGAKKLILMTDNRLRAAVSLYRKLGFRAAPNEAAISGKYARAKFGFAMKLDL
jgi:putative acetyltransferase